MCPVGYGMNQGQGICDLSNDVISSDLEWPLTPGFKVMILCDNGAFVQLQILHLLNLQCNAPLSRSPSAIAEYLVYNIYSNRSYDELDQAHIRQTSHPTYCKAVWICTLTRSFCFPPGRLTMLMWSCIKSWPVSVLAFAHIKLHRKWMIVDWHELTVRRRIMRLPIIHANRAEWHTCPAPEDHHMGGPAMYCCQSQYLVMKGRDMSGWQAPLGIG